MPRYCLDCRARGARPFDITAARVCPKCSRILQRCRHMVMALHVPAKNRRGIDVLDVVPIDKFDIPLPPARPIAVEERMFLSKVADRQQRLGDYLLNDARSKFDGWKKQLANLKTSLDGWTGDTTTLDIAAALESAEKAEAIAETIAIDTARLEKRIRKDVKQQFKSDPSLGAVTRAFGGRLLALEREKIDTLLDAALFIRSWAADHSERGEMQSFDDPAALMRALAA